MKEQNPKNKENSRSIITEVDRLALLRIAANQGQKGRSIQTDGTLLGVLPRENSRETRYSWAVHRGHPYLRIQDFQFDVRFETWAPVKGRCFSVRIHELAAVKAFIQKAISMELKNYCSDVKVTHKSEIDKYVEMFMKNDI